LQAREVSGATVSLAENQFIFEITPWGEWGWFLKNRKKR
jgi:hypothetical protein